MWLCLGLEVCLFRSYSISIHYCSGQIQKASHLPSSSHSITPALYNTVTTLLYYTTTPLHHYYTTTTLLHYYTTTTPLPLHLTFNTSCLPSPTTTPTPPSPAMAVQTKSSSCKVPMVVVKLPSSSTKVVRPTTRQDPRTGTSSAGSKLSNAIQSGPAIQQHPAGRDLSTSYSTYTRLIAAAG